MHVLVTGGAGFIGSHLVDELVSGGHEVTVLDSMLPAAWGPGAPRPSYLPDSVRFVHGDVRDADLVSRLLGSVDAVSHQAAMVGLGVDIGDITDYVSVNDLGTATLLRAMAAAHVGRLVLASSMVVYGEGRYRCAEHGLTNPAPRNQEDLKRGTFDPRCPSCSLLLGWEQVPENAAPDPRSVYAATKAAQENLATVWAAVTGATSVLLRYHNVYGPRMPRDTQYAGVASIFRSALERGQAPRVFEDGRQMRDFIHVRDVAHANILALQTEFSGTFNVASGAPTSVGEMARALSDTFGEALPVITGEFRVGDVRHIVASPELAQEVLGFRAAVMFDEGIREFATAPLRGSV